jgi:hypothetical protein
MPDDPLNTDPPTPPVPPREEKKCICEFCGCQLTPRGEVLRMGEAAKGFRKHEEIVEERDREISRLTALETALRQEIADLKKSAASSGGSASFRPGAFVG